jgi:hypothetical protein
MSNDYRSDMILCNFICTWDKSIVVELVHRCFICSSWKIDAYHLTTNWSCQYMIIRMILKYMFRESSTICLSNERKSLNMTCRQQQRTKIHAVVRRHDSLSNWNRSCHWKYKHCQHEYEFDLNRRVNSFIRSRVLFRHVMSRSLKIRLLDNRTRWEQSYRSVYFNGDKPHKWIHSFHVHIRSSYTNR